MIKKIFINITVGIISVVVVVTVVKAFTGPGSQPPIGNPIFWTKSGSDVYYNAVGGNVGIGLTGPAYKLDVNGQINTSASGGLCIAGVCKTDWNQVQGTSYWTQSGSNLYASSTSWNVGIGVTDPGTYKLKVGGTTQTTGFQLGTTATAGYVLTTDASGVGTWQAVSALPSGASGQTLRHNGTTWVSNSVIYNDGTNVGIGTTSPDSKLDIENTYAEMRFTSTSGRTYRVGEVHTGSIFSIYDVGTSNPIFNIVGATGNVGIGTTSPGGKLEVASKSGTSSVLTDFVDSSYTQKIVFRTVFGTGATDGSITSSWYSDGIVFTSPRDLPQNKFWFKSQDGTTRMVINSNDGNVGIGTISPGSKLTIAGGNLELSGGNITGVNKLTANSIDPVFKINGKNYATWVSDFAGGLRVDTSGVLKLDSSYEIDFNNLNEGSDLWLFWQTSNKNINDLSVILTSGFDGKVWYEKGENKIIIHTEKPGEISYRLSAPRIDNNDGNNLADDQSIKGIDVLDYQK